MKKKLIIIISIILAVILISAFLFGFEIGFIPGLNITTRYNSDFVKATDDAFRNNHSGMYYVEKTDALCTVPIDDYNAIGIIILNDTDLGVYNYKVANGKYHWMGDETIYYAEKGIIDTDDQENGTILNFPSSSVRLISRVRIKGSIEYGIFEKTFVPSDSPDSFNRVGLPHPFEDYELFYRTTP